MENVKVTTMNDSERMFKILTDLMNTNKEFHINIIVPGQNRESESEDEGRFFLEPPIMVKTESKPEHDLEQDAVFFKG